MCWGPFVGVSQNTKLLIIVFDTQMTLKHNKIWNWHTHKQQNKFTMILQWKTSVAYILRLDWYTELNMNDHCVDDLFFLFFSRISDVLWIESAVRIPIPNQTTLTLSLFCSPAFYTYNTRPDESELVNAQCTANIVGWRRRQRWSTPD